MPPAPPLSQAIEPARASLRLLLDSRSDPDTDKGKGRTVTKISTRRRPPEDHLLGSLEVKMTDNREAALRLIEMACKHLTQFTLWGALFYVYNAEREHHLSWATSEALKLAEDAFDHAVGSWLGDRISALSRFRTGKALIDEAAREGRDPIQDAVAYLTEPAQ